jgi:hypothetical protein
MARSLEEGFRKLTLLGKWREKLDTRFARNAVGGSRGSSRARLYYIRQDTANAVFHQRFAGRIDSALRLNSDVAGGSINQKPSIVKEHFRGVTAVVNICKCQVHGTVRLVLSSGTEVNTYFLS